MEELDFQNNNTQNTTLGYLLAGACFLTVLSQLPQIVALGLSSLVSQFVWILFTLLIFYIKKDLRITKQFWISIGFLAIYIVFVALSSVAIGKNYFSTSLFSVIILSAFVLFVGTQLGASITREDLILSGKAYVLASLIVAVDLYFFVFRGADVSDVLYAYASKNSAGVILMTAAIVMVLFDWTTFGKIEKAFNIVALSIFIFMIFIMKTRAMIVCIPIIVVMLMFRSSVSKKLKVIIVAFCVIAFFSLQNETVYDLLINQILLGGRRGDINDVSSGRFDQWKNFGRYMEGNWILGDGHTELESLILTALVQCGAVMGALIILYALWPLFFSFDKIMKGDNSREMFLLLMISIVYFIDAIFEQLAPFGPGARCFYLWLILGILLSKRQEVNNRNERVISCGKYQK